jgi:5'(3')-deoxyribonucleotidase
MDTRKKAMTTIKVKTKRMQKLEKRLENKVSSAKEAIKQLEEIEKRAKAREKSKQIRQSDKDKYTLGLLLKYVYMTHFKMPSVKEEWILEAFPKEKPERYIECLKKHGIEVIPTPRADAE